MNLNHALIHANRQLIQQHHNNCGGDVWYAVRLAWEAMCFPDRFVKNGGVWTLTKEEERGMVCNIGLLWAFLGVILRGGIAGVQHAIRVGHYMLENGNVQNDELWELLDTVILSLAMVFMGVLIVACLYVDGKSPNGWMSVNAWNAIGPQPLIQYVASFTMTMIVLTWLDFYGPIRGFVLWSLVANLSLVHTSFLAGMIEKLSGARNVLDSARVLPLVTFGLRYGFSMYLCDFLPTIGATLVFRLVPSTSRNAWSIIFGTDSSQCFLSHIGTSHATIALVAYFATSASMNNEPSLQPLIQVMNSTADPNNNATIPASGAPIAMQRPSPVGVCVAASFVFSSVLLATV
jgi:hypothetical protein